MHETPEKSGKDLCAICFACGKEQKKDSIHKAGRMLMKSIHRFYKAHPNLQNLKQHGGVIPKDKEKMTEEDKRAAKMGPVDGGPPKSNEILIKQTSFDKVSLAAQEICKCVTKINWLKMSKMTR